QPSNPNLTQLTSTPTDVVAVNSTSASDHNTGTVALPGSDMIFSSTSRMLYIQNISTPGSFAIRRPPVGPNNQEDGLFGTGGNSIEMDGPDLIAATFFGIDRYSGVFPDPLFPPVGPGGVPVAVATGLANPTNLMIGNSTYGTIAGTATGS